MNDVTSTPYKFSHHRLAKLAKEVAYDHYTPEQLIERNNISISEWSEISAHPTFVKLLKEEILAWNGAANTNERIKLKSAALVENWLKEANEQLHNPEATLSSKTELAKLLTRIGGMGLNDTNVTGAIGEKVNITINLGDDRPAKFTKDITIESKAEVVQEE